MKILFLTLSKINTLEDRGIYTDLLRKFQNNGHEVFIVSPSERRENKSTSISKIDTGNVTILNVKTFNIQKTNIVEKGIGTLAIEYQYLKAIKKHFSDIKFDLVLYSTPPITFSKVISFIKNRDKAYAYLLLKDIFPQNAVDMKLLKKGGLLHRMFVKKEQRLYNLSDTIGCMSKANKDFVVKHNAFISANKIEINPNTIELKEFYQTEFERKQIREKYNVPIDKKVFIYGGNLGKPQGVDFLIETIESTTNANAFFLVIGSGTEYSRIEKWFQHSKPNNAILIQGLPKTDYDQLLLGCDVGLIFLHKDFTIPNFPSRFLSYLEMKLPVIAATDSATDIGSVIEENNCGFWMLSGDNEKMQNAVEKLCKDVNTYNIMSKNAFTLLQREYRVEKSFDLIINKLKDV